ncbi:MAG: ubiquitin-like protein Pup [Mycobacteriales bacterium]
MATKDSGGQAKKSRRATEEEVEDTTPERDPETAEHQEKLGEDVDDMLDEIDSVLEENAEEFVRGYVQKGGQ